MAFVLHQTWDATASAQGAASRATGPILPLLPLLANRRDPYLRKTGATLLSVLVHILLLWLFVTRLAGNTGPVEATGAGSGTLTSFTLSGPAAASAPANARVAREQLPAVPNPSEVDATVATELPPPEWTISRLPPAPRPQGAQASAPASASAAAGASPGASGAGAGAGRGGSEVYDPYAGAAPLRLERDAQAAAPSLGERVLGFFGFGPASSGGLTLDEAALEAIRRAVVAALPGRRGTAELAVRVSPAGVVLEVIARGGSAPPKARAALGRALVGKKLYRGSAVDAQILALPVLSLG